MSINYKDNGSTQNVETKLPKAFATFNTDDFTLDPSDKTLGLSDRVTTKLQTVDDMSKYGYLRGKNILSLSNKTSGYYLTSDGNDTNQNDGYSISDYLPIFKSGQYVLSGVTATSATATCWYDENKNYIGGEGWGGVIPHVFNIPSNARYIRTTIRNAEASKMMLEYGETATEFEEYTPSNREITKELQKCITFTGQAEQPISSNSTNGNAYTNYTMPRSGIAVMTLANTVNTVGVLAGGKYMFGAQGTSNQIFTMPVLQGQVISIRATTTAITIFY